MGAQVYSYITEEQSLTTTAFVNSPYILWKKWGQGDAGL